MYISPPFGLGLKHCEIASYGDIKNMMYIKKILKIWCFQNFFYLNL